MNLNTFPKKLEHTCLIPLKNVICLMSSGSFSDWGQWKLSRSGIMLQPQSKAATISWKIIQA